MDWEHEGHGTSLGRYALGVRCMCMLSCVRLLAAPWTVACQAPLSMGFSRQEYQTGLPFPSPRNLPDPGIEPRSLMSPAWQADSLPLRHRGKAQWVHCIPSISWGQPSYKHSPFKKKYGNSVFGLFKLYFQMSICSRK